MNSAYSKAVFGKWPKLVELCSHFQVELTNAHDARGDSKALAQCVIEAIKRGVMFDAPDDSSVQTFTPSQPSVYAMLHPST